MPMHRLCHCMNASSQKIKKLNGYHLILINRDITIFISLFFPIILYEKFS